MQLSNLDVVQLKRGIYYSTYKDTIRNEPGRVLARGLVDIL
jgi:hypothetical protein